MEPAMTKDNIFPQVNCVLIDLFIYLFIDIFKEGSLISDPALLSIRALYIQNTNTTRFKNYKQDTLEYISNGKITKKSIKIAYKAQVILPIK